MTKRLLMMISAGLLWSGWCGAQVGFLEDVKGETDSPESQSASAKILVLPHYIEDPDGSGFNSAFTGFASKMIGDWDFQNPGSPLTNNVPSGNALSLTGDQISIVESGVSRSALLAGGTSHFSSVLNSTSNGTMDGGKFTQSIWFRLNPGSLEERVDATNAWNYNFQMLSRIDNFFKASNGVATPGAIAVGRDSSGRNWVNIRALNLDSAGKFTSIFRFPSEGTPLGGAIPEAASNSTNVSFMLNFWTPANFKFDDGEWHHLVVVYDGSYNVAGNTTSGGPFAVYLDQSTTRLTTNGAVNFTAGHLTARTGGLISGVPAANLVNATMYFGYGSDEKGTSTKLPAFRLKGNLDRIRVYGRALSATEVGYLLEQDADEDDHDDIAELKAKTDPLNPNSPNDDAVIHDDDIGTTQKATITNAYSKWDFEETSGGGKIEDLIGGNDLTISAVSLDDGSGNAMPSVSARFFGSGGLSSGDLDWGQVAAYSTSTWLRFENGAAEWAPTGSKVVLWEIDGAHGGGTTTTSNQAYYSKLVLSVEKAGQPGERLWLTAYYKASASTGSFLSASRLWTSEKTKISDGNWHHVTLNRNMSTGYSLWVDGNEVAQVEDVFPIPPNPTTAAPRYELNFWNTAAFDGIAMKFSLGSLFLSAGQLPPKGYTPFRGNMDKARVWRSALTSAQIGSLYYQDSDGDFIADAAEIGRGLNPLDGGDSPPVLPAGWIDKDDANLAGQALAAQSRLIAHWNFEEFKYGATEPPYFQNRKLPAIYKLVPNSGVFVGTQNRLTTNYAELRGMGAMETYLGPDPDGGGALKSLAATDTWAMGGWLRLNKDSIWQLNNAPTPLWELRNVVNGIEDSVSNHYRLYAVRQGQYTQVFFTRFNAKSGLNESTSGAPQTECWILPRSVRLDDEGWHHLMLQKSKSPDTTIWYHELFLDGVKLTNTPKGFGASPTVNFSNSGASGIQLRLGLTKYPSPSGLSANYGMKGAWDRFRVYDTAIGDEAIEELYLQDTDGDGDSDIAEYGVMGRDGLVSDRTAPNVAVTPTGTDPANVDVDGVPPSLNRDLLGLWDFETFGIEVPGVRAGFPDRSGQGSKMIPGGTTEQAGPEAGSGMPSRSAFVKDGGYLAAQADYLSGEGEFTTSFWVKADPGLLESSPLAGVCLLSFEDLQSPADANTLSLTLSKAGASQCLKVQNYGTSSGFIKATVLGEGWSLLDKRIDDGTWHHVAWVRGRFGNSVYVDGLVLDVALKIPGAVRSLSGLITAPVPGASPKVMLGRVSARSPGLEFKGNFDRVRLYGKALDSAEIGSLYQQDFDGDGFSDFFELGRFGFDPMKGLNAQGGGLAVADPAADYDNEEGLAEADKVMLRSGLVGDWGFEYIAEFEAGDATSSIRFPAQQPPGTGTVVAGGQVQWNFEDGMLSRSVMLEESGYLAFPATIFGEGGDDLATSFWVRMDKDEIANRGGELVKEKIALLTFGTKRSQFPHFIASVTSIDATGGYVINVDTGFSATTGLPTSGFSWRSPVKLDDGRWHQVVLNLGGSNSELIVDNLRGTVLGSGTFPAFPEFSETDSPYLWMGFRKNRLLDPDNQLASALKYTGFSGSIDRVRFYDRKLNTGAVVAGRKFLVDNGTTSLSEISRLYFQDWDKDGRPDIVEVNSYLDPYHNQTAGTNPDSDGDGIVDVDERTFSTSADFTTHADKSDWRHPDMDGDWMWDGWEKSFAASAGDVAVAQRMSLVADDTLLRQNDADGDTLKNWQEFLFQSNPYKTDSDNDGHSDLVEYQGGSNPNQGGSLPATVQQPSPVDAGTNGLALGYLGGLSSFQLDGPAGGDMSYSYNGSDATGPRYRKVALNGRPMADEAPESEEESDGHKEETYVDSYSLGLHFDHSLIYVPLGSSELKLQATLSLRDETWNHRSGIRPEDKVTSPFGPCWSTNLCAYVEETVDTSTPDTGPTPDTPIDYSVVDEDGRQLRFGSYDGRSIFPYPGSLSDRKSYLHKLDRQSDDTLVLRKKFGTVLTYKRVDLNQWHLGNRGDGTSGAKILHRYYRLVLVEDRFGNQLRYNYPNHNKTLIPNLIFDPKRDGQRIKIEVDPAKPYRIARIFDPRNQKHEFAYTDKPVAAGTTQSVLTSITDPLSNPVTFGYEAVTENDSYEGKSTVYYSLNLNAFTSKRGVSTLITYQPDDDKFYSSVQDINTTVRRIFGLPRLVKTIRSAASASVGLPGASDVEQIAEFSRKPGMRWLYTGNGVRLLSGGNLGTPTTDWYNEIRDGVGNTTTYVFRDVRAGLVDTSTHGTDVSLNWMIYYLQMDIIHPASLGTETYKFDLASGLSLAETVDICSNKTQYRYNDSWGGVTIAPSEMSRLAIFGRWSDPSEKIDALGNIETYAYSPNFRMMSSVVDKFGSRKSHVVDRLGRRISVETTDKSGRKLGQEVYEYNDPRFPSFTTRKVVKTFGAVQSWEKDLGISYLSDQWGRVAQETVEMQGQDDGNLVTANTYDLNGNRTSTIDPKDNKTYFIYDPLNRLSRTLFPAPGNLWVEKSMLYDNDGNKHAEIDENGNITLWMHDALGRVRSMVRDMNGSNALGKIQRVAPGAEAPAGQAFYWELSVKGNYDIEDIVTHTGYNDVNTPVWVADPKGIVTLTVVDAIQRPTQIFENFPLGGNPQALEALYSTSPERRRTSFAYFNQSGFNTGSSIFEGKSFKPTYTKKWNAVRMPEGDGFQHVEIVNKFDSLYRPVLEEITYEGESRVTNVTHYEDSTSTQTVINDEGGTYETVTVTEKDGLGRPVAVIQKNSDVRGDAITRTTYSSTGLPFRAVDPEGRITLTEYDAAGRPVLVKNPETDAGSAIAETNYDKNGNVEWVKSPLGRGNDDYTIEYTYDERNRKIEEKLPEVTVAAGGTTLPPLVGSVSARVTTIYDAGGRVISQTDARGAMKRTYYDRANRPKLIRTNPVSDPLDSASPPSMPHPDIVVQNEYDLSGNVITAIDGNGNTTRNYYDVFNRLTITATNPVSGNPAVPFLGYTPGAADIIVTNYYDDLGNLIQVTDGENHSTAFRYDGLGRKRTTIWDYARPAARVEEMVYDGAVLLEKRYPEDEGGASVVYTYNDLRQLVGVSYPGSAGDNRLMTYDLIGNLLTVRYETSGVAGPNATRRNITQTFDAMNRVKAEVSNGKSHSYTYDLNGNRISVTFGGTGKYLKSDYDELNQIKSVKEYADQSATSLLRTTNYYYNAAGDLTYKKLPNSVWTSTVYDKLGRKLLISDRLQGASGVVSSFDYSTPGPNAAQPSGYDKVGNVIRIIENYADATIGTRSIINDYDKNYRILKEDVVGVEATEYSYDKANNRLTKKRSDPSNAVLENTGYSYGAGSGGADTNTNQLKSWGPVTGHTHVITYDKNGNRASLAFDGRIDLYGYDKDNRLITVNYQTAPASYASLRGVYNYLYDHRSRRVRKSEPMSAVQKIVNLSFSGGTSALEWESDAEPSEYARQYVRGSDNGGGIGGILYSLAGATAVPSFSHYNSRGDVVGQSNDSGQQIWQASYEAFGTRKKEGVNPPAAPQRANTKEEDPTGLLNEGFRYRDLVSGVYLTRDPAGFIDGPNVYTYVKQNPWTHSDPTGLAVKIGGEDYKGDNFGKTEDEKTIFRQYIDTSYEFKFSSVEAFKKTVSLRGKIIESAKAIKQKGVRFGGQDGFQADQKYWETEKGKQQILSKSPGGVGKDWNSAMEALMSDKTLVDCCGGATLAYLYAFHKENSSLPPIGMGGWPALSVKDPYNLYSLGDASLFGPMNVPKNTFTGAYQHFIKDSYVSTDQQDPKRPLIMGDWVYFSNNPVYNATKGDWRGEHAIFSGVDSGSGEPKFLGHGVSSEFTQKTIRQDLLGALRKQIPGKSFELKDIPEKADLIHSP